MKQSWLGRYWASFSFVGLLTAALFFAASLTPSLIPRTYLMQGLLCGFSLAAGYTVGVSAVWLWQYLELPKPGADVERAAKMVITVLVAFTTVYFLWWTTTWQNSIRELMEMEPVDNTHRLRIALIGIAFCALLIALTRLLWRSWRFLARRLNRIVPRRISYLISFVVVIALFASLVNGVFFEAALRMADSSLEATDALIDPELDPPTERFRTGGAASLIPWETLGHRGRQFIATGPSRDELTAFTGQEALQPLRVYVGRLSADGARAQATLALQELQRVGAFERSVLIIATPTGTGWLDPAAVNTVEYLHRGDTAIVAIQYSYLLSWLSLLIEPDYAHEAAGALFDEVYGYWTKLPRDERPKLYLYGLSLGAYGSESSADVLDILDDPFQGALWSGPPFTSAFWAKLTERRNAGSPAWLPRFGAGRFVRFTGQKNALNLPGARWGPVRIVYLQYASDPITFFSPDSWHRKPDWLVGERGPDVSPYFSWYPIVTFLQLVFDMTVATSTPIGYGHVYAPAHYIDTWIEVTEPTDWSSDEIDRLKSLFEN